MLHHYHDIRSRIAEPPLWWDEHGVPRYVPFAPDEVANIYARECALVLIACQACAEEFQVAFSHSPMDDVRAIMEQRTPRTLADSVRDGSLHYGDPPNAGCCPAGPTMNCDDIRVLEFWQRDRFDWERVPALEISLQ
jgi:hypothetical protein